MSNDCYKSVQGVKVSYGETSNTDVFMFSSLDGVQEAYF